MIALTEFDLANYAEARSDLLEAHRLYPNARTLRALGMVEFELKNYPSSVSYLEQALASDVRALTAKQRSDAEALLERAQHYIGRYKIALRPREATLLVDGQPTVLDAEGWLVLSLGDHPVEASAPGHRTLHRTLRVVGASRERLDLVLLPAPLQEQAPETPVAPASARNDTPVYQRWWLWTTIGVVVAAGAATGLVLATRSPDPKPPQDGSLHEVVHLLQWR